MSTSHFVVHIVTCAAGRQAGRPATLSSESRPLLAVSGSSWRPARSAVAVLWIVGGRLPLRVYRGPGQSVAPQSSCPGSSRRQGSHLPYTSVGLLR